MVSESCGRQRLQTWMGFAYAVDRIQTDIPGQAGDLTCVALIQGLCGFVQSNRASDLEHGEGVDCGKTWGARDRRE